MTPGDYLSDDRHALIINDRPLSDRDASTVLPGLGVIFQRAGDRFSHQLFLPHAEQRQMLATSAEGTDQQPWPGSPVVQQLDRCPLPEGRQGLVGVGMAGVSHWSLAIEVEGDSSTATAQLRFDVACRVKRPPGFLGSSYQLIEPLQVQSLSPQRLRCQWRESGGKDVQDQRATLEFFATEPNTKVAYEVATRRVVVTAAAFSGSWPATVRWGYCVMRPA
jgi:hypothetical protein